LEQLKILFWYFLRPAGIITTTFSPQAITLFRQKATSEAALASHDAA
jgi:hypothetical protein